MPMLTDIGLHHYGNTFNDAAGPVSRAASVLALGVTCTGLPGRVTLISSKKQKRKGDRPLPIPISNGLSHFFDVF